MAKKMKRPSVLAFDSSTPTLTLAYAASDGRIRRSVTALKNTGGMLGVLAAFLKKHKVRIADADLIAVGTGPGSFTGLRVGVTCAKMLAYASGAKLAGISTLRVIAQNVSGSAPVCVALDARRGNVYTAVYREGRPVERPRLVSVAEFTGGISAGVRYAGDAIAVCGEGLFGPAEVAAPEAWKPDAARMVEIALERWEAREFDDPLKLAPDYLYGNDCMVTRPVPRHGKNA